VPQVACFDTAFHHAQHDVARRYGLPRELHDVGIKRYGFHGLSFEYIARALPRHLGDAADGRVIVAHLGSGASLCALRERKSVATTMGFTPLDGLVMGTRCGTLDPGVLLYLLREKNLDAARLEHLLYHESGLLGVSGISADMQVLLRSDDARAREAVELFVYRVAREIGSLAAALGGLDALVFTGGIGENAAEIRQRICADAAWLGVRLDEQANVTGAARISASNSAVSAWIIPTREDEIVARQTWRLLSRLGSFPNAITPR
jgi:acetate kinase